jgi:hypothetical protein
MTKQFDLAEFGQKNSQGACPSGTASPGLRPEPQERLVAVARVPHGAGVADFIDHLASIETPAMRAVRIMAKQIREQEG